MNTTLFFIIHNQVRVNGVSDTETVMNPVWIPWCSLLPARLVQLGSNIRHLPLERHIAWRGRLLAGSRKDIKSLGNFSICTSGSNVSTFIEPRGDLTLVRNDGYFSLAIYRIATHKRRQPRTSFNRAPPVLIPSCNVFVYV